MAGINPADYQGYIKSLNIQLPNMPPSTGAQPPATPTGGSTPPTTLTPGYMQPKPAMPMAAPTTPSTVNAPQYTPSQLSARDWINNPSSEQGGIDAYTARQNQRYADAFKTGDQDLLGRLQNDSQRVGYTLNMPKAAPVQQTAVATAPPPMPAPTPAPSAPNTINTDAIRAEVEARLAQQRAGIKSAVDYTKTNLKNAYDYTRGLQNDQRVLEDVKFNDTNNPFSGATGYRASMMDRNRSIADTAQNKDYAANVSAADQRLADFDALAPEQKNALYDQLLRTERDYGLNVGQLTGNFNGDRTLAGSAQDANYLGTYQGQQTLQAQNQSFNQNLASQQFGEQQKQNNIDLAKWGVGQYGYGTPKSDAGVFFNQYNGAQTLPVQQFEYGKQQDAVNNQVTQQKLNQDAQQFAASQGIQWANLNQRQKEFIAEQTMKKQQFDSQNDPNSLENQYKQAQIDSLNGKTSKANPPGIDEYDIAIVDNLAKQAGLSAGKSSPDQIRSFVADLKGKYGWTADEARSIESHLSSGISSGGSQSGSGSSILPAPTADNLRDSLSGSIDFFKNIPAGFKSYADYLKSELPKYNPMNLFK